MSGGLLDGIWEIAEITRQLETTPEEAYSMWREIMNERVHEYYAIERAAAESNVIPFRMKH